MAVFPCLLLKRSRSVALNFKFSFLPLWLVLLLPIPVDVFALFAYITSSTHLSKLILMKCVTYAKYTSRNRNRKAISVQTQGWLLLWSLFTLSWKSSGPVCTYSMCQEFNVSCIRKISPLYNCYTTFKYYAKPNVPDYLSFALLMNSWMVGAYSIVYTLVCLECLNKCWMRPDTRKKMEASYCIEIMKFSMIFQFLLKTTWQTAAGNTV